MLDIFSVHLSFNQCWYNFREVPWLILGLILAPTILFLLVQTFHARQEYQERFRRYTHAMVLIVWAITAAGAVFSYAEVVSHDIKIGAPKMTNAAFYHRYFEELYDLAKNSKALHPSACNARLISDNDLTKEPGHTFEFFLGYFLYPIDIRTQRDPASYECLVIFDKKNAISFVPADFKIIYQLNQRNIFATRNK